MSSQDIFKALSDPTRREILRMLRKRPMSAGELSDAFPMTKGSLSHHYNILKGAELVRCERRGQFLWYSLNTSVIEDVMAMLADLFGSEKKKKEKEKS
ncbi:MAG TPA: autorepressor SdpR family transcription factor [Thermoanaerobaculia bacterium]|nr:autorepressor SdpR family transcription factor [Thermoanaerobaculia bacterium]